MRSQTQSTRSVIEKPCLGSDSRPLSLRPSKEKNDLTDQENPKQTTGGLVGKVAGKAKEAAGSLVGNGDLAREGRLQQAQADAEARRSAATPMQSNETPKRD